MGHKGLGTKDLGAGGGSRGVPLAFKKTWVVRYNYVMLRKFVKVIEIHLYYLWIANSKATWGKKKKTQKKLLEVSEDKQKITKMFTKKFDHNVQIKQDKEASLRPVSRLL
jgi:hypothetical protein